MAQHPSLRSSSKDKQHRSVLKRFERIEVLKKKELWKEGEQSAFGLPKVKVVRFKVKKEKPQEAAAAEKTEAKTVETGAEQKAAAAPEKKKPEAKK